MVTISQRCPMISPVLWKAHKLKLWIIWRKSHIACSSEQMRELVADLHRNKKKAEKKKRNTCSWWRHSQRLCFIIIAGLLRKFGLFVEVSTRSKTLMWIKEANFGPPWHAGLVPLHTNQRQWWEAAHGQTWNEDEVKARKEIQSD